MSKLISELLDAHEPMFSISIRQLEKVSSKPSTDIKLAAEIINKVEQKAKDLSFDPKDTTGRELYHGLMNRIKADDEHFAGLIGTDNPENPPLIMIKNAVHNFMIPRSAWVLKKSSAKEFLRKNPPPATMKHLRYKSIESMLKSENVTEIYGALRFAESLDWLKKFNNAYKNLTPSDFEQREIEVLEISAGRWGDLVSDFIDKKMHCVTHSKEFGAVYLLPPKNTKGLSITIMSLVLHYINEIRLYSSFFKLKQVNKDFGKIVAETLNTDPKNVCKLAGHDIHWRVIQRYYGKQKAGHPEIFEPHVQPEDLIWRQAEHQLQKIDERFGWWLDQDYVAVNDKCKPVSLNLMDAVINYSNGFDFEDRVYYHFREALWNELFARYMGENILEQQILKNLDGQMAIKDTIHSNLHKGI